MYDSAAAETARHLLDQLRGSLAVCLDVIIECRADRPLTGC